MELAILIIIIFGVGIFFTFFLKQKRFKNEVSDLFLKSQKSTFLTGAVTGGKHSGILKRRIRNNNKIFSNGFGTAKLRGSGQKSPPSSDRKNVHKNVLQFEKPLGATLIITAKKKTKMCFFGKWHQLKKRFENTKNPRIRRKKRPRKKLYRLSTLPAIHRHVHPRNPAVHTITIVHCCNQSSPYNNITRPNQTNVRSIQPTQQYPAPQNIHH